MRVLSDFDGEMANDLSIKTGDILTIKELRYARYNSYYSL